VLEEAAAFYQQQLDRCPEALDYLHRRGVHDAALFRELCIGYAPGGTLRRYLTAQGHSFDVLRRLGLINVRGADALYVRFQSSLQPPPSATTINDRTATADRAIRNQFPDAPCQVAHGFHQPFLHRRPMGLGRPRFELSRLRVWEPRLNVVPLSVDEVARFWRSFRNARDLAIVGLMLMQGLRSAEVMALNHDDVLFSEGQLRVRGKGNKLRLLPLAPETTQLLDHYLRVERPDPCSAALFVVLKGPARGQRMTPAGLRSLFRHHRRTTGVELANPHQFRHTFASDMVRAGISLPALMQLMGHADIETTMHYVKVSPQDVYLQYARAAAQCIHPQPRIS
jgi:integrase